MLLTPTASKPLIARHSLFHFVGKNLIISTPYELTKDKKSEIDKIMISCGYDSFMMQYEYDCCGYVYDKGTPCGSLGK